MPYLVLAAGALMTIAGFYAVVTGYGVVQLEQGWSAVISGATLIAGGVVTMAMALLLRTLNQIKGRLGTPLAAPVVLAAGEAAPPAADIAAPPPLELPKTPAQEPPPVAPPAVAEAPPSPSLAATLDPAPVPPPPSPPPPLPEPEPEAQPKRAMPRARLFPITPPPAPEPRLSDEFTRATPSEPVEDLVPAPAPPASEPAHEQAPRREQEPAHAQEPTHVEQLAPPQLAAEPASPPMDDWLDRAFADLDQTPPPRRPDPDPQPTEPAVAEAVAPAVAEAPAPPAAAPSSPVIGRYEADGTSYVMYADGSIEAQSEAGVYRFASMAELKAFIET